MRFAYIDSQEKEVGIPSVEALQLRIELGAIGESTMFYDAVADRWAPAGEHEIFRTLAEKAEERDSGGFVAPPPEVPRRKPKPPPETEAESSEPEAEPAVPERDVAAPEREPTAPPEPEAAETEPEAAPPEPETTDVPEVPEAADMPPEPRRPRAPNPFAMEERPRDDEPPAGAEPRPEPEPELQMEPGAAVDDGTDEEEAGYDFSEFGTMDLEESFAEQHGGAADPGADQTRPDEDLVLEEPLSGADREDEGGGGFDFTDEWSQDSGLELEDAADAAYAAPAQEPAGEPPEPPAPQEPPESRRPTESPAPPEPAPPEPSRPPEEPGPPARPPAERTGAGAGPRPATPSGATASRKPRAPSGKARRPEGPSRRKSSSVPGWLVVGLLLVVLAGGGWFGWQIFHDRFMAPPPEERVVQIPTLPADLQPVYEDAVGPAWAAAREDLRSGAAELPSEPPDEWLAGVYLANASDYAAVETYWRAIDGFIEHLRSRDLVAFVTAFRRQLDEAGIEDAEARQALEARARAGFQAAAPDREDVYIRIETLSTAALDLHDFLVGNESAIDYDPSASGLSRDPVMEAVPETDELRDELWDRVGRITDALDALGALDRVSTARLADITFERLAATEVR